MVVGGCCRSVEERLWLLSQRPWVRLPLASSFFTFAVSKILLQQRPRLYFIRLSLSVFGPEGASSIGLLCRDTAEILSNLQHTHRKYHLTIIIYLAIKKIRTYNERLYIGSNYLWLQHSHLCIYVHTLAVNL